MQKPWFKITDAITNRILYIGRDKNAAKKVIIQPKWFYNCYSSCSENGPWYWDESL